MQLTAAKLLSADVLMLAGPSGHSDINDMSGVRTCWRTSLLASSVPHTSTPFLEQDVHAQRRLPEPQTGNLQGHEGQLLDTARREASREACFDQRVHGAQCLRARVI